MLQKKSPVKPEHTERTGFEDAIRSRKAALGQRCAAGVPEMNAVDGFPARDMGMPAQDHIAGAHAGNGGATGKVVSVLCHDAQSVSGYHGAVFHRERKQHEIHFGVAVAAHGENFVRQGVELRDDLAASGIIEPCNAMTVEEMANELCPLLLKI